VKDHKVCRLLDDTDAGFELGLDQVGIQAPPCIVVMPDRHLIRAPNPERCDGGGDKLRVGVLEGRSRLFTMVLEDDDVAHAWVAAKRLEPRLIGLKHPLDLRIRHQRHHPVVHRRLDDHLVRAHAIHLAEEGPCFPPLGF
jgi:hypothetical protein